MNNNTINGGRSEEIGMWLWTATYVKKLEAEKFDGTRHRRLSEGGVRELKVKSQMEPKKANGDREGSSLLDGCRIMMRPYEGRAQYDGTTTTREGMEQVTFST